MVLLNWSRVAALMGKRDYLEGLFKDMRTATIEGLITERMHEIRASDPSLSPTNCRELATMQLTMEGLI